jgi:glycosyltransferase involved in cell wall biosynthesis
MNRQGVPLVSILIPAFNAERWIAETIRSALSQTWPRIEVIVVDDGSGDATLAVARRFEAERVKVVGKANQGAAAARNHAFQLSRGDYIQWLDADDLLAPDKIERQLAALPPQGASSTLLSGSWAYFAYRPQRAVFVPTPLWEDLSPVEWLHRKMSQNLHMQTSTWLTSRELALAAGPWDETLTNDDDGEYFCRVLLASTGTGFVAESKVFYRKIASNSLSFIGSSPGKMRSLLRSMRLHIGYLRSLEDSARVREACLRYIQNWSAEFDPCLQDLRAELAEMAAELGGTLVPVRLRPKYAWIAPLIGDSAAWRLQLALPQLRGRVTCAWDRAMARAERGRGQPPQVHAS